VAVPVAAAEAEAEVAGPVASRLRSSIDVHNLPSCHGSLLRCRRSVENARPF